MNIVKIIYLAIVGSLTAVIIGSLYSVEPRDAVKELSIQLQKIAQAAGKENEQLGSYELRKKYENFPKSKLIKSIIRFHYNEILKKYGHLSAAEWTQAVDMIDKKIYRRISDFHDVLIEGSKHDILDIDSWIEMVREYPEMAGFFHILKDELRTIYQHKLNHLPFSSFLASENGVFKIDSIDEVYNVCQILVLVELGLGLSQTQSEEELFTEYRKTIVQKGHSSVSLWWHAFNSITIKQKKTNTDIVQRVLQTIKDMSVIAIQNGKGDIAYSELLATLESFYSDNKKNNKIVDSMIKDRKRMCWLNTDC